MAEILDIVDEQGRPTGQTVPRAVAHAEGIRHRTSHVWILRRHAGRVEVLLHMRCQATDSQAATTFPRPGTFLPGAILWSRLCGNCGRSLA